MCFEEEQVVHGGGNLSGGFGRCRRQWPKLQIL